MPTDERAMTPIDPADYPKPLVAGLKMCCPRCGKGKLFKGFLTLRKKCDVCGLNFDFADPADGPAFFVMCFAVVPALAVATVIEISYEPPVWVHLITTLPMIVLACIAPLRPLKAWLVASQFYHDAAPGKYVAAKPAPPETHAPD
ncbi:DUF983 domain-containing protein [Acuticoccus sp. MNP-M23]|uniref:DUF983 domain-containing protein n=1 Tax=Acuticoccus sp. MNP-M23 TaxID=3072793 RepID=UPI002815C97C|nr:DUF983 domain-containing protein [Acuticoccus sp. MNP-M23]WMS44785.1 DUF983 domain-containing protein [Acuticoccus sp. MNP-M23]